MTGLLRLFSNVKCGDCIQEYRPELSDYATDESGIRISEPILIAKPENAEQISLILRTAYKNDIVIVPRGLGTGLSGGAIPVEPSIIVSTERMNRILEIDKDNLMVRTQPGVITGDLQKAVEEVGLFYPPDPASLESCSIGGNIAESSGGPRAVKYGTTRDYVRGIEFVSPEGHIMRFGGKLKKDATGYNIKDLFIGSEGTLGILTEATLSLLPKPVLDYDLLIPFASMHDAAKTVSDIIRSRIIPATIEFMDERALQTAYRMIGEHASTNKGNAQLLIKIDGNSANELDAQAERIGEIADANNALDVLVADSKPFQEILWKARRSLHDAVVEMSIRMEREDIVVPPSRLPELIDSVKELESEYSIMIVVFGHAGDGNVHINMMKTEDNAELFDRNIDTLKLELMKLAVSLGGHLSGEHGIGVFKKDFMHLVFNEHELDMQKRVKQAFDPKNLFNPGKVLP